MNRGANVSVLSRSEETRFLEEKSALKRQLKLPLQLGLKIKLYKREKIKLTFFFLSSNMAARSLPFESLGIGCKPLMTINWVPNKLYEATGHIVKPYFSNSLIIHQVKTKKITSVKEVWIPGLN